MILGFVTKPPETPYRCRKRSSAISIRCNVGTPVIGATNRLTTFRG